MKGMLLRAFRAAGKYLTPFDIDLDPAKEIFPEGLQLGKAVD